MKHLSFYLLGLISCLFITSCSSLDNQPEADGTVTLKFGVTNYIQTSLDDVTEDVTRAAGSVDALSHLALAVFDAEGNCVQSTFQDNDATNYGSFSVTLAYGEYTFVFLGYNGNTSAVITSPTNITFTNGAVPNCFCRAFKLDVKADTQGQSVSMSRCVGCFTARCSKGIPTTMTAMNYEVEGGGTTLNAMTGLAASVAKRTGSIDFSTVKDYTKGQSVNIYMFLPTEQADLDFTLSAVDKDGNSLRTRVFEDVPMKLNKRIYYDGDFFASDANTSLFTLSLDNADWDEMHEDY